MPIEFSFLYYISHLDFKMKCNVNLVGLVPEIFLRCDASKHFVLSASN